MTEEVEAIDLRTTFTRDGFSYKQIWRDGDVAVYEYDSRGGSFDNLSKYSPEATLLTLAGRITVVAAMEANLHQTALEQSLPGICLSRTSPGGLKGWIKVLRPRCWKWRAWRVMKR